MKAQWLLLSGLILGLGCQTTTRKVDERILLSEKKDPEKLRTNIQNLRKKAEEEPKNPKWQFLLGRLYEQQKQNQLAEIRYRKALRLIPRSKFTGIHYRLGRVLALQGKYNSAIFELRRCVGIKQSDPDNYYLNPDYRESYFLLGKIYQYVKKDRTKATECYEKFLEFGGERMRVVDLLHELKG
jgi:tetratricopeptide (TPR) repeat protein